MRKAGLDEAQAGIKIARRNINNLRCADDTTLMAESEEELKSLLMKSENSLLFFKIESTSSQDVMKIVEMTTNDLGFRGNGRNTSWNQDCQEKSQ